jgi:hypothetical protein
MFCCASHKSQASVDFSSKFMTLLYKKKVLQTNEEEKLKKKHCFINL